MAYEDVVRTVLKKYGLSHSSGYGINHIESRVVWHMIHDIGLEIDAIVRAELAKKAEDK